jgi:transposase
VILTHEAGRDLVGAFSGSAWRRSPCDAAFEPSRGSRKTDVIDVEMLLRTLMAWLRAEPRVCSMVPIPTETDEEARRAHREREDLISERLSILNKLDSILATLGVKSYRALRRDRREQLALLRQPRKFA